MIQLQPEPYWCGSSLWTGPCTETRVHHHSSTTTSGIAITSPAVAELAHRRAYRFTLEWTGDGHLTPEEQVQHYQETMRAMVDLLHAALGVVAEVR